MTNAYVEFYGKHNISPVKQNISDYQLHLERRKKLYRHLGMPTMLFENSDVLEVGSGGGYNTLAFFEWGAHVDIVEPNKKGIEDMKFLFDNRKIEKSKYRIFHTMIEEYSVSKKYDIIIAEGFLPSIENTKEVIERLKDLLKNNGIIVVTCIDEMGMFIEQMKRLVAHILIKDLSDYDDRVKKLLNEFEPQLKTLNGVSRSAEDWVQDQLLNSAINSKAMFSLIDAIAYFGEEYNILGSSPDMFTDYSWYKNIWYDIKESYVRQFHCKHHNLLIAGTEETLLPEEKNRLINEYACRIRNNAIEYEIEYNWKCVEKVMEDLIKMRSFVKQCDAILDKFIIELVTILTKLKLESVHLSDYPKFFQLFGRSQQYISFVKQ